MRVTTIQPAAGIWNSGANHPTSQPQPFYKRFVARAFQRILALPLLLGALSAAPAIGQSTTVTTLGVYPSNTVAAGTPIELLAGVQSGGSNLSFGVVSFCDANKKSCTGSSLLGQAEVTNTPVSGTAAAFVRLGIGTHKIKAVFSPQSSYAGSVSTTQTVTVTGSVTTNSYISSTGSAGNYSLTGSVHSSGRAAATGSVSFLDTSDSNFSLGSAALTAGKTSFALNSLGDLYVGLAPTKMAVADFNNDGVPDIAVVNVNSQSLQILYGDGKGSSSYSYQSVVTGATGLAVGDFNGDGIPDIAVLDDISSEIHILQVAGDMSFTEVSAQTTGDLPESIAAGDFNGDGIIDLIVGGAGYVEYFAGTGYGSFDPGKYSVLGSTATSFATADFNGDGHLDIGVGFETGPVEVLLGDGNGNFVEKSELSAGNSPGSVAVGDFNEDGIADIASISPFDFVVHVFLGVGDGTFTSAYTYNHGAPFADEASLVVADVDGDGHQDIAFLISYDFGIISPGNPGIVGVLAGNGKGSFTVENAGVATGNDPLGIVAGDWNGDGFIDLAVSNAADGDVQLFNSHVYTSSAATLTVVSIPGGGSHNVLVNYAGVTGQKASKSSTIALTGTPIKTATTLSVSPGLTITKGQTVQLTATLAAETKSNLTPTGSVKFLDGTTVLGTVKIAADQALLSDNSLAVGKHSITAVYTGDANFVTSTSAVSTVTVNNPPAATPTFTPTPGTYTGKQTVKLADTTAGATIYYTVNGTTPTTASTKYAGPITVSATETVKAIATAANFSTSAVATGAYTIH